MIRRQGSSCDNAGVHATNVRNKRRMLRAPGETRGILVDEDDVSDDEAACSRGAKSLCGNQRGSR